MVLTLELSQDLERKLAAEATRLGLPLQEVALRRLGEEPVSAETIPKNGAELVAYWRQEGVIGSRPDIEESRAYARELRRQAERRSRG